MTVEQISHSAEPMFRSCAVILDDGPEDNRSPCRSSERGTEILFNPDPISVYTRDQSNKFTSAVSILEGAETLQVGWISWSKPDPVGTSFRLEAEWADLAVGHFAERIIREASERFLNVTLADRLDVTVPVSGHRKIRSFMAAGYRLEGIVPNAGRQDVDQAVVHLFLRAGDDKASVHPTFPDIDPQTVRDEKIALRIAEIGDAKGLWLEQANGEAKRWGLFEPASLSTIRERANRAGMQALVGSNLLLTIIDLETESSAGKIVIRNVVPPHVGDVGYGIVPQFRGRGYATRALRLLLNWAFEEAGYARLELGIKEGNTASVRVVEKTSFVFEGIRPGRLKNHDGTFSNELHYYALNPNVTQRNIAND